jgi:glutathione-regulated potassium-efflux system ancillary protein KefG
MAKPEAVSTLVVFAHPALERARVNAALGDAAARTPGVTFHDLYETYPDFAIDVRAEQKRLCAHELIVLQFPLYWYSTPALLKEWLDLVWLHGYAYGDTGRALEGKTLACAVSTGGRQDAYGPGGGNRYTLEEFLRPLEQTARLCRMHWAEPFVVHGAGLLSEQDLSRERERYRSHLNGLIALARQRERA